MTERLYWIVREYYWDSAKQMRQKTDAEYADDLAEFIGPERNAKVIIDPSAASFKAEMTKRGEEKPLKIHDHGPDAFRYFAKTEVPYWRLAA